jgi:hypothetical protein
MPQLELLWQQSLFKAGWPLTSSVDGLAAIAWTVNGS